ncbi:MAG: formylglycine-generating enzyme family protein [Deltaproteobacteria bacterium]|nr:formylglycine-generating enzyme family protein [Deltaproteobacteria bacterium]
MVLAAVAAATVSTGGMKPVPGGEFKPVFPPTGDVETVAVEPFLMDERPVTNEEFARFLAAAPKWRRDRILPLFADESYLGHWPSPESPAKQTAGQPVTHVSWFAAKAYCESRGARLPLWYEWELAAAADETRRDARSDPAWRQKLLRWYEVPGGGELPEAGRTAPNVYGLRDLHGVIWEWVLDFNALLVSTDSREAGGAEKYFCGAGALAAQDKENYAMFMRVGFLSSLQARYTTARLGFRCARSATGKDV